MKRLRFGSAGSLTLVSGVMASANHQMRLLNKWSPRQFLTTSISHYLFFNSHNITIQILTQWIIFLVIRLHWLLIINNGLAHISCAFILSAHYCKLPVAFLVIIPCRFWASSYLGGRWEIWDTFTTFLLRALGEHRLASFPCHAGNTIILRSTPMI